MSARITFRKYPAGPVAVLTILLTLMLLPILWMILSAAKSDDEINRIPPTFLPKAPSFDNFTQLFTQFNFGQLTINSVIVSGTVVILSIGLGGAAAYGFSRYPFLGSRLILSAILVTRMITPVALILPLYLMMDKLQLLNSLFAVTVGITALNLPFAVWLLKPFFDELPKDVEDAALLDGLGPIGVWWRIAVPIAAPGIVTVAVFSFVAAWTDLLIPITMSTRPEGWTLTAGIMQMQTGFKIYWGALMSASLYLTIPTFLIAVFAQKYLTRGVGRSV
jgi:ABC-type glycerol-3-phosphate transport system permease component